MGKIISKLKGFFDDIFYPNSNLLKMNHYPPVNKRMILKQESVPPMPDVKNPTKIKKFPFCKSKGDIHIEYYSYCVECVVCGAEGPYKMSKEEAIKAWNRRVSE